jgi:hypothetical protein
MMYGDMMALGSATRSCSAVSKAMNECHTRRAKLLLCPRHVMSRPFVLAQRNNLDPPPHADGIAFFFLPADGIAG